MKRSTTCLQLFRNQNFPITNQGLIQYSGSQPMAPRPETSASPGKFGPFRSTESESYLSRYEAQPSAF